MKKITVHMTKEALFDFLLFHAYSKFSGFLVNILGLAVAFMGIILYISDKASHVEPLFLSWSCIPVSGIYTVTAKKKSGRSDEDKSTVRTGCRLYLF